LAIRIQGKALEDLRLGHFAVDEGRRRSFRGREKAVRHGPKVKKAAEERPWITKGEPDPSGQNTSLSQPGGLAAPATRLLQTQSSSAQK
jgi:hypothetical protein